MSTTAPEAPALPVPETELVVASALPDDPSVRTFRGRSLEELLPQIRDQLGPDAVVLRQRDGLMGGIGGFFQQRFVEVDARAGAPRIDVYDEAPEAPAAPDLPDTFAAMLAEADAEPEPALLEARPAVPASALTHELTAQGMSHAFAERLVADAEAHELPFADGDLRAAARRALARRLPTALPHRAGGLAVAFAGPGSTACADALATAYKRAGRDARAVASLDKARALLERGDPDAVLAVDLPPIAAARDEADGIAARLGGLALDELVVVIPAGLDLSTARALLDRLQPLSPTALALSLDAEGADVGAALELACTSRLPIAYVQDTAAGLAPADPHALAERLLR